MAAWLDTGARPHGGDHLSGSGGVKDSTLFISSIQLWTCPQHAKFGRLLLGVVAFPHSCQPPRPCSSRVGSALHLHQDEHVLDALPQPTGTYVQGRQAYIDLYPYSDIQEQLSSKSGIWCEEVQRLGAFLSLQAEGSGDNSDSSHSLLVDERTWKAVVPVLLQVCGSTPYGSMPYGSMLIFPYVIARLSISPEDLYDQIALSLMRQMMRSLFVTS